MRDYKEITIELIEDVVGMPVESWGGECHLVSKKFVENVDPKIVDGHAPYGKFKGEISQESPLYNNLGFARHGWVETKDGVIIDPTRWYFENVEPYVFIERKELCSDYDVASSEFTSLIRKLTNSNFPSFNEDVPNFKVSDDAPDIIYQFINETENDGRISIEQLGWIVSTPPDVFESVVDVRELYDWVHARKMGFLIPIDFKSMMERPSEFSLTGDVKVLKENLECYLREPLPEFSDGEMRSFDISEDSPALIKIFETEDCKKVGVMQVAFLANKVGFDFDFEAVQECHEWIRDNGLGAFIPKPVIEQEESEFSY